MSERLPPGLHIVATPIGNLGDLSERAAETLRRADRILVEDTRVTAKLLQHIGAKVPMTRYDDHSSANERERIVVAARRARDRARQRCRDAADLRSRLQAGARGACRRPRGAHDTRTLRGDRRIDSRRAADRPLPVPRLPSRQGEGSGRGHRGIRRRPGDSRPLRERAPARRYARGACGSAGPARGRRRAGDQQAA